MEWQVVAPHEIATFGKDVATWKAAVVDTETDGLNPYLGNKPFGLGFAPFEEERYYYLPLQGLNPLDLRPLMEPLERIPLMGHNIKFDLHMMAEHLGWQGQQEMFMDTLPMLRLWEQDERPQLGLKEAAKRLFDYDYEEPDVVKIIASGKGATLDPKRAGHYCCEDLRLTKRIYKKCKSELPPHLLKLYAKECRITRDLFDIERHGVMIDTEYLQQATRRLDEEMTKLLADIQRETGKEDFNPGSPPQVAALMADLKIASVKRTKPSKKNPSGGVSWSREAMLQVRNRHPIALLVAKQRALSYQRNGTIDRAQSYVNYGSDILHGEFKNWGTVTGRLSGDLQQLPKGWLQFGEAEMTGDDVLKWAEGEFAFEQEFSVRRLFRPRPGYVFVKGDYKQIEMFVLGFYMKDKTFDRWLDSEHGVHYAVAQEVWGDGEKYKARGKVYNFATVYGQGKAARAKLLCCTEDESEQYKREYDKRMPGHRRFMRRVERLLEQDGCVKNFYGREYYLAPNLAYKGVNYITQGSAGDFVKQKLPETRELRRQMGVHVPITTHDDFLWEVPLENIGGIPDLIAAHRTSPFGRDLELDVEYSRSSLVELSPVEELVVA